MSKQTITEKSLVIRREKRPKANTKIRVADVIDDLNETKADKTEIPTKTSELQNDGQDGLNPFITIQDIPVITVPTKTSDLANNGEGISPFITLNEVPPQTPQVKSDWNAVTGPEEILNKPTIPVLIPQEQSDWNATSGVSFIKNKPTIPAPVDISGKLDKPLDPNNTPDRVILADGSTKPLSEITTDISGKLDKPTTDGSWVVTKAGNQITYTSANNFGKNIANSSLTSVAGAGMTLGAPYTWSTASQPFSITGLSDKSADTTYNKLLVENNSGQVGLSDGKTLLKSIPSLLNESEKTIWKTEMNGGWTTNTMSVAFISPPIAINSGISYLTLIGANLNLNPLNFSVKLINQVGGSITTIPNNQVILTSPTELTFWYDFTSVPLGSYKVLLNNGIAEYLTPTEVDIVLNLDSVDISDNTWDVTTFNGNINPTIQQSNTSFSAQNSEDVIVGAMDGKVTLTATSKTLGNMSDDFYIKMGLWNTANTNSFKTLFGGLSNDISPVNISNIISGASASDAIGFFALGEDVNLVSAQSPDNTIIFYKKGTFLTTIVKGAVGVSVKTSVVSNDVNAPIKLKMVYLNNLGSNNIANIIIHSVYKI